MLNHELRDSINSISLWFLIEELFHRDSDLADVIQKIITSEKIDLDEPANVFIGQDTRSNLKFCHRLKAFVLIKDLQHFYIFKLKIIWKFGSMKALKKLDFFILGQVASVSAMPLLTVFKQPVEI